MSVIVKHSLSNESWVFGKGSPEKIKDLCLPSSIPFDYDAVLN